MTKIFIRFFFVAMLLALPTMTWAYEEIYYERVHPEFVDEDVRFYHPEFEHYHYYYHFR